MADEQRPKPWWAPDLQGFVAVSVVVMTAIAISYRMSHPSQIEDKLLDMMLTLLVGTAFVGVVGWAVGSSRGSEIKDVAQTKMVEKLTTAPTISAPVLAAAATLAAEAAAPAAAERVAAEAARAAAPPAAEVAAPPAAEAAAPAAAREAVADEMAKKGLS